MPQFSTGSYYTSQFIANKLISKTFYYWFLDCWNQPVSFDLFLEIFSQRNQNQFDLYAKPSEFIQKLELTKILDPAVGAGVFLINAANFLEDLYVLLKMNVKLLKILRKAIISKHLFGWDINPSAIITTINQFELWINNSPILFYESDQNIIKKNNLESYSSEDWIKNFQERNSLLENSKELDEKFTIIVGNPPFGNLITIDEKKELKKRFKCRTSEISELFIEKGIKILSQTNNSILTYIIPKSIAYYQKWQDCRNLILQTTIREIIDLGIAFPNVNLEQIAIIIELKTQIKEKKRNNEIEISSFLPKKKPIKIAFEEYDRIPQEFLYHSKILVYSPLNHNQIRLIEYMRLHSQTLFQVALYKNNEMNFKPLTRSIYISDKEKSKLQAGTQLFINKVPDIESFLIKKLYRIKYSQNISQYLHPKLIFKVFRGSRLSCFADVEGILLTTEKMVNFFPNMQYRQFLYGLQCVLNCRPASFYLQSVIFSQTTETSRVLDHFYASHILLPNCRPDEWELLTNLGQMLILCAINQNLLLYNEILKLSEIITTYFYFLEIIQQEFPFIIKQIEELSKKKDFIVIMELMGLKSFKNYFRSYLNHITLNPPINHQRNIPSKQFMLIWDKNLEERLLIHIKNINTDLHTEALEHSWIFLELKKILGK